MPTETLLSKKATTILWVFVVIAVLGFADATYLTASHYLSLPLPCGSSQGCDIVTNSSWSEFLGIPVALFGAIYYLTLIIVSIIALDRSKPRIARLTSHLTLIGLISSTYFMVVQFFIIKAICIYCTASALICLILFMMGFSLRKALHTGQDTTETPTL